jgi:hypothetical protein
MKVALTLDRTVNHAKPTNTQAALITKRLRKAELVIGEFAPLVVFPFGFSFTPAVYSVDGNRTNKNWVSQQIFAIDIDSKLSFEAAIARAKEYEIIPALVYATFSSDESNNKYRLLWVMSDVVTDTRVREVIQAQLMAIYPEADPSCKDAARLFYGGQRLIFESFDSVITLEMLNFAFDNFVRESDKSDNAGRTIKRFAQKHQLGMVNGTIVVDVKNSQNGRFDQPHYNTNYNSVGQNVRNGYIFNENNKQEANTKVTVAPLLKVDFNRLAEDCNVFSEFMQGIDVHHSVTWFIMCNLLRIEGGEKVFWKGLRLRDEYDEVKWERLIRYWRATGGKYSPGYNYIRDFYDNSSSEFANLFQVAESQFGRAKLVEAPEYVSLETAEANLNSALEVAIADTENRFFVIKAQVGLGKTESIINHVENGQITHAVIAVPRHDLKDEFAGRFLKRGITVQVTPELPEGPWTPILEALYAKGAFSEAHKQLEKLATTTPAIKEYTSALRAIRDEGIIITTHARLNYFKTSAKLTIIDEDKLLTDVAEKSLSVTDLFAVTEAFRPTGFRPMGFANKTSTVYDALLQFSDLVRQAITQQKTLFSLTELKQSVDLSESMREIESAVVKANILGNVMEFLTADIMWVEEDAHKVARIYYGTKPTYPTESTVVMLSATANESHCRNVLGDRLIFIHVGFVATLGKIYWHLMSGLSRSALKTAEDAFYRLLERFSFDFIGYKSLKLISDRVVAHFGALTGLDFLKGRNLGIAGVPHLPMRSYIIAAALCGEDLIGKQNLDTMVYEVAVVNGYQVRIMQPAAECLRSYQRWFISSELDQAVGRARSLREPADVHVFGNWPIFGAMLVK